MGNSIRLGGAGYADGGAVGDFSRAMAFGEQRLRDAPRARASDAMSGVADARGMMPAPVVTTNHIEGDKVTVQVTNAGASPEQIAAAIQRNNAQRDRTLGARMTEYRQRFG